jgi:hypothetical protein
MKIAFDDSARGKRMRIVRTTREVASGPIDESPGTPLSEASAAVKKRVLLGVNPRSRTDVSAPEPIA